MKEDRSETTEVVEERTGKLRLIWHYLWPLLLILVIVCGGLLYVEKEYQITNVTVTGCDYYTEDEIKEKVMHGKFGKNAAYLYLKYRYFSPDDIPFVEKIDIELVNHNEILISVYEKSMIASVFYMNEYLYFDKDGIVIESSPEKMEEIPVIDGLDISSIGLHEKLGVEDDDIFDVILNLSQLLRQYEITTTRVCFNYKEEVILYCGKIKVLLGKDSGYDDKIAELAGIIKKAKKNNLKGTLDMSGYVPGQSEIIFKEE